MQVDPELLGDAALADEPATAGLSDEGVVGTGAAAQLDIAEHERIVVVDRQHAVVFRHPLVRSAVVELAGPEARRRAHRALAKGRALDPGHRAWHLADASFGPDEEVASLLQREAIQALKRGDPTAAVAAMTRSADLSPDLQHRSQRLAATAYFAAEVMGDLQSVSSLLSDARRVNAGVGSLAAASAAASLLLYSDGDVISAYRVISAALRAPDIEPAAEEVNSAIWILSLTVALNGRKEMWDSYRELVERFRHMLPESVLIRSEIATNPATASPEALATLDRQIAALATERDPGQIIRVAYVANDVDRLADLREPLLRVWREGMQAVRISPRGVEGGTAQQLQELWPFERARVLLAYGEHLRRERATVESRVYLTAALALFDRLRAAPWAERARNEMSATGLSRRQADVSQVQLTPQELQIATLAASGLTNKAIGERLHLSARTVSGHLYNVFPKLGVTARAGLRDALTALGQHDRQGRP